MLNVFSQIEPEKLIFTMIKKHEITSGRKNLTPDEEFLQVGVKKASSGDYFKPHKHLACDKRVTITQEAWVILNGKAQGTFYDLDNTKIHSVTLNDGDCVVIYNGGHSLEILEDDTILYEFKNGPYFGPEKDKTFLRGDDE
jgi:anti-sigma factor ChrR (cupin superfamily)|tara:strand:+ start:629 stop:1051 length:423 start_codon:yes stop_codon:yes gene_type:complete